MKIWVNGTSGQVGGEIQRISKNFPKWQFVFTQRQDVDLSNFSELGDFVEQGKFNWIVNCAAYTAVDNAEEDVKNAEMLNSGAVKTIVDVIKDSPTRLLQLSTDFVFDGNAKEPYSENEATFPLSAYGKTKLKGEQEALRKNDSLVFRTSWVYAASGKNFVKTMLRLAEEREELNVVADQVGGPTYAKDLADVILEVLGHPNVHNFKGVYHVSNSGQTTWYHFAKKIFDLSGVDCAVHPIASALYPTKASRPRFSVLNNARLKRDFGLELREWELALVDCLKEMKCYSKK